MSIVARVVSAVLAFCVFSSTCVAITNLIAPDRLEGVAFAEFMLSPTGTVFLLGAPATALAIFVLYRIFLLILDRSRIKSLEKDNDRLRAERKVLNLRLIDYEEREKAPVVAPGTKSINVSANPRPKKTVEEIIKDVEVLQNKKRVTPKMVIKPVAQLEKLKNKTEHRDNIELQRQISDALNWGYGILGSVQYDINKIEKRITERTSPKGAPAIPDAPPEPQETPSTPALW